jgi:hypothetical protein
MCETRPRRACVLGLAGLRVIGSGAAGRKSSAYASYHCPVDATVGAAGEAVAETSRVAHRAARLTDSERGRNRPAGWMGGLGSVPGRLARAGRFAVSCSPIDNRAEWKRQTTRGGVRHDTAGLVWSVSQVKQCVRPRSGPRAVQGPRKRLVGPPALSAYSGRSRRTPDQSWSQPTGWPAENSGPGSGFGLTPDRVFGPFCPSPAKANKNRAGAKLGRMTWIPECPAVTGRAEGNCLARA